MNTLFNHSALRIPLAAIVGVAAAVAPATTLWFSGGQTVFTGTYASQGLAFLMCAALVAARAAVADPGGRQRHAAILMFCDLTAFVLLLAAWELTHSYFLGWLSCFASGLLTMSGLVCIAGSFGTPNPKSSIFLRGSACAAGLIGLGLTAPIHHWAGGIVDALLFMTLSGVLLGLLSIAWIRVLTGAERPNVVPATQPIRRASSDRRNEK